MGKCTRFMVLCAMWSVLVANGAVAYLVFDYDRPGPLISDKTLVFPRNQSFGQIIHTLQSEGVIRHKLSVKVIAVLLQKARLFKAGEYHFPVAVTAHKVVDMMVEGRSVMRKVTAPEGKTVAEIVAMLNAEKALSGEISGNIREGSLLPETYMFTYGDSRQDMINRMQKAMDDALKVLWEKRQKNLPLNTAQEALILASIVEKETGIADERPRVAAVFINRLRKGMRLQSDPTAVYGLLQKHGKPLGRALWRKDLKIETPYNTYIISGLPPTPIANPGMKAIEAVLNPPQTKELYFVATGTGGHNFSTSLKEHNRNVRQYRKVLSSQK